MSLNAIIQSASNAPAGSLFQGMKMLDKLPRLKSPETFTQTFPFSTTMKFKVKLYKQDDEGMQELENQSKRLDGEIRKDQVLLNMGLYKTIYIETFPSEDEEEKEKETKKTVMMTVLECAYHLLHVITEFLENQDFWDPRFVKCGGLYLSLNDVHVFFNIEKMFFAPYQESTFETMKKDEELLSSDFFQNKNFFILKLVLSHFLEFFLQEQDEKIKV